MDELRNELLNYLPKLIEGINDLVDCLHIEDNKQAFKLLRQIIEGMDWASRAYSGVSNSSDGIAELNRSLLQATEALNKRDYVLVADLFEYEIIEVLKKFKDNLIKVNYN